jgi:hypothetical protein
MPLRAMKDVTPKARLEGQRGYVIRTRSWESIIERYRGHGAFTPMLQLVGGIASSPASSELFAATSMFDLLLSDGPDFRSNDSTLRISYRPRDRQFEFRHVSFSGCDDRKVCGESEAFPTLRLFLRLKYGVLFEIPAQPRRCAVDQNE